MSNRTIGFLLAALGSVLFAGKAIAVKFTYRYGIDPVTLIAFRMLFALPFFAVIAWHETRRARLNGVPPLTRQEKLRIVLLGLIGYYLSSFLDFIGLQYISAGLERAILFLSPTFVLLMTAFWLKRPIARAQWVAMALAYAGVLLVFVQDIRFGGGQVMLGSLCVLGAAFSYACYLIGAGELIKRVGSTRLVAYAMCTSCVVVLLQFFIVHDVGVLLAQPAGVYGWSLIHATLNTVLPVFMIMWSVERIGAAMSAQLGMLGPISLLFMAAWWLDEPLTLWHLGGTVLVIMGTYVLTRVRTPSPDTNTTSARSKI